MTEQIQSVASIDAFEANRAKTKKGPFAVWCG